MTEEATICKHCGKPIEDGQAWHTVAEMHYDCYLEVFGEPKPLAHLPSLGPRYAATPQFEGFKVARANGGHMVHIVDGSTGRALCGHAPKNESWRMRQRGKWLFLADGWEQAATGLWPCKQCEARRPAPAAVADLETVIERCIGGPR